MSKVCYRPSDKSMFAYHDSLAAYPEIVVIEYDEAISLMYGAKVEIQVPVPSAPKRGRPRKNPIVEPTPGVDDGEAHD